MGRGVRVGDRVIWDSSNFLALEVQHSGKRFCPRLTGTLVTLTRGIYLRVTHTEEIVEGTGLVS